MITKLLKGIARSILWDQLCWYKDQHRMDRQRIQKLYEERDRLASEKALLEAELRVARGEGDGSYDIEDPIEAAWPDPYQGSLRWANG